MDADLRADDVGHQLTAFRNEWEAAVARAAALEHQLREARSGQQHDAATIAMLTQALHASNAELARLRGPALLPPPGMAFQYPPRGTTVLAFGIVSILLCNLMGPIAWSMGNAELARIDAGQTDPRERGNAQAGRVCGMIGTGLMVIAAILMTMVVVSLISAQP